MEDKRVVLRGPREPAWICSSCKFSNNWASRLRCRECDAPGTAEQVKRAWEAEAAASKKGKGRPGASGSGAGPPWRARAGEDDLKKRLEEVAALFKQKQEKEADDAGFVVRLRRYADRCPGAGKAADELEAHLKEEAAKPRPLNVGTAHARVRRLESQLTRATQASEDLATQYEEIGKKLEEAEAFEVDLKGKLEVARSACEEALRSRVSSGRALRRRVEEPQADCFDVLHQRIVMDEADAGEYYTPAAQGTIASAFLQHARRSLAAPYAAPSQAQRRCEGWDVGTAFRHSHCGGRFGD